MKANLRQRPIDDINLSMHVMHLNELLDEAEKRLSIEREKTTADGLDLVFLWMLFACLSTAALIVYAVEKGWM